MATKDFEPTENREVNWLSPEKVGLAVARVVEHYSGWRGEVVELPGDGTVWIQPFRGDKVQVGLDAFNSEFLIRKDF